MKTMTKETKEKIRIGRLKTKEANQEKWAKQVIPICKGWTIMRCDEMNWVIPATKERGGGPNPWYFGKLIDALRQIPDKKLNLGDKMTLQDILRQQREIREMVDKLYFAVYEEWQEDVNRVHKGTF